MLHCSRGDFERAIYDLEKHFGLDCDGKTNRECIEELKKVCPKLHSDAELEELGNQLLDMVCSEFGWKGLRVWFELDNSHPLLANEMLAMKYSKLYDDISKKVDEFRVANDLTLILDVYLFGFKVKESYRERYGEIGEEGLMDLYSLVNTVHLTGYQSSIIKELEYSIKFRLICVGDKYYSSKDLTSRDVLRELYEHLGEIVGDDDAYQGHMLFYDYDGYGGSYCTVGGDIL